MIKFITTLGTIVISLDFENAPVSAENFQQYCENGHYESTIFHRVIDGFMIQGGGMDANMKEKPSGAPIQNEANNGLKNTRGTLAMARTGDPHSATAQFFINVNDNSFLDHTGKNPQGWGYAVFGEVVEGMDVVDRIKGVDTGSKGHHQDVPVSPSMKSIFIADLHLSTQRPDLLTAFYQFLHELNDDVDELFILGDLFESWLGDDDRSILSQDVQAALKHVRDRNILTYFQCGNRDFLVGRQFAQATGIVILEDIVVQPVQRQQILLMHGDLLCTDDNEYQRFRKKIQSPLGKTILKSLPLFVRQRIAKNLRGKSQQAAQNKPENIMDVNPQTVRSTLVDQQTNLLIHGHTHRPGVENLSTSQGMACRYTLGDWDSHAWWLEVSNENNIELKSSVITVTTKVACMKSLAPLVTPKQKRHMLCIKPATASVLAGFDHFLCSLKTLYMRVKKNRDLQKSTIFDPNKTNHFVRV